MAPLVLVLHLRLLIGIAPPFNVFGSEHQPIVGGNDWWAFASRLFEVVPPGIHVSSALVEKLLVLLGGKAGLEDDLEVIADAVDVVAEVATLDDLLFLLRELILPQKVLLIGCDNLLVPRIIGNDDSPLGGEALLDSLGLQGHLLDRATLCELLVGGDLAAGEVAVVDGMDLQPLLGVSVGPGALDVEVENAQPLFVIGLAGLGDLIQNAVHDVLRGVHLHLIEAALQQLDGVAFCEDVDADRCRNW